MRRDLINEMFATVDACRWDGLRAYYHPDCRYDRPGFELIQGVDGVLRFYAEERPIASGVHRVDQVVEDGERAVAFGGFDGKLRDGRDISLSFADHYRFEGGLIRERRTYFYAPLA